MRNAVFALLAVAVALAAASAEQPDRGTWPAQHYSPGPRLTAPPARPVADVLRSMPAWDRTNARLQLIIDSPDARKAEEHWNAGRFEEALAIIERLAPQEYGIAWRVPVPAPEVDWGNDVLVTPRDSVVEVELDVHRGTGNLFCVTRFLGDGAGTSWSTNLSTNGGQNWAETYRFSATYEFGNLGAVCQGNYCYIGFPRWTDQRQALLVRCQASDGAQANFPSGPYIMLDSLTGPRAITEVEVWSNADTSWDNRVYYSLLTTGNTLKAWWMNMTTYDFTAYGPMPVDVERGLDITWNQNYSSHYVLLSAINTSDQIRVWGVERVTDTLEPLYTGTRTSNGDYTGVTAWKDTLLVCFDQQSSNRQARYLTSYNAGATWLWGVFGDTTANFTRSVDVCGKLGSGQGAAYWQFPQNPWGVSFTSRSYTGPWSRPVRIQGPGGNTFSTRVPDIRRIAPGIWGVAFFYATTNGMAMFDRSDWTGIAEPRAGNRLPRPGAATIAVGTWRLDGDRPAQLYDRLGRQAAVLRPGDNDLSGLKNGVYFLKTQGSAVPRKLLIAQ